MPRPQITLCYRSDNAAFHSIVRGIYRYARDHENWEISLTPNPQSAFQEGWKPSGIIGDFPNEAAAKFIHQMGIPFVSTSPWPLNEDCHSVSFDEYAIGVIAAEHFCDLGVSTLVYVSLDPSRPADPIWKGFQEKAETRGRRPVFKRDPFHSHKDFLIEPLSRETGEWFSSLPVPSALFVPCDRVAMQTIESARQLGLRIPTDLSVLGLGNNDFLCELSAPSLSSVQLPADSCGFEAARALAATLRNPLTPFAKIAIAPTQVATRRSTTPPFANDPIMVQAMEFIRENFAKGISIKDIVRELGISRSTLERRFRDHLGTIPTDEIGKLRLQKACELLTDEGIGLADAARRSGFGDSRSLNYAIQKKFGVPASVYRSQLLAKLSDRVPESSETED